MVPRSVSVVSKPAGAHALMRRTHEERVLRALRDSGALSRGEIAEQVGLSRTTLSDITNSLLERGAIMVVNTDADERSGRGRPAARLALDPDAGQLMGVDFGHGRVHIAVADASHSVIASGAHPYDIDSTWTERIQASFDLMDQLGRETGAHYGALQGIGIGFPGPFSSRMREPGVLSVGNEHRMAREIVSSAFVERFRVSVIMDNNTRFAGLAEAIWSDADTENLIYVRLSDGIGAGLVVGGRLVIGSTGLAGELGHISVRPSGVPCGCGKRGCLETIASVPAILASCQLEGVAIASLDELDAAVAKADPIVDKVLREAGEALGRVLGAVAVTLNPSQIVIGGEIIEIAPTILQQAIATITYELLPLPESTPIIRSAKLGDDGGSLGAIAAIFHESPLLASYPRTGEEGAKRVTPDSKKRFSTTHYGARASAPITREAAWQL